MAREITVAPVLNGWLVKAGCQHLVYEDKDRLVADFSEYLGDPDGVENRILAKYTKSKVPVGNATAGEIRGGCAEEAPSSRGLVDRLIR